LVNPTRIFSYALFALIALCSLSHAATALEENTTITKYDIQMYIEYNKVLVESDMRFKYFTSTNFSIELPYDARKIINSVDGFKYPAILDANDLVFNLKNSRRLTYSYITNDLLDGDSLITTITTPYPTDLLHVKVNLPEGAVLGKPLNKGAVSGRSVYPASAKLETDGTTISASWDFENVEVGDEIALYVSYKKPLRYIVPTIIILAALILILVSAVFIIYRKKGKKTKQIEKQEHKEIHVSPGIENHLKEDEEQVINLLKLKEGKCEQGTLRVATGFSKAKLSMLLKELEERKIIHKEKSGKKNLVYLKT